MTNELNRFAITALSRKHKNYSQPHEIMVHKEIGQILIKTPDGDVISHDSITRVQNHIENVSNRSRLANLAGDLYILETDIELPEVITENVSVINSPLLIKSSPVSGVMISIDLDSVTLSDQDSLVTGEPLVDIVVDFKKTFTGGAVQSNKYTITKNLSALNTLRIEPRDYLPTTETDYSMYSMYVDTIRIRRDPEQYGVDAQIRNILHSIVVVTE